MTRLTPAFSTLRDSTIALERSQRLLRSSDSRLRALRLHAAERQLTGTADALRAASDVLASEKSPYARTVQDSAVRISQVGDRVRAVRAGESAEPGKQLADDLRRPMTALRDAYMGATGKPVHSWPVRKVLKESPNNAIPVPGSRIARGYAPPAVPEVLRTNGRDLTAAAQAGTLDPMIGRSDEIGQLIEILGRRGKSNVVVVGEAGVGKTAVVEGLAQRIVSGDVPEALQNTAIVEVNMGKLESGTKWRGSFEGKLQAVLEAAEASEGRVLLFFDEFHEVLGAGSHSGQSNVGADILKKPLARGRVKVIGATTADEFRTKVEGADPAIARRFEPVHVLPPSPGETQDILDSLMKGYRDYYGVEFAPDVAERTVAWTGRYVKDRNFPDKAIDILDRTSSRISADASRETGPLKELRERQGSLVRERHGLIGFGDASKGRIDQIQQELEELAPQVDQARRALSAERAKAGPAIVTAEDIATTLSARTGIPMSHMINDSAADALQMAPALKQRVINQDHVIDAISDSMQRVQAGFSDPTKPIGKFGVYGPTGVGKTELGRALAEYLFGDASAMVRVDGKNATLSTLVGSGRGIKDAEKGGILTEPVRQRPFQVVLVDEHEKVAPEVNQALLQVLDDGYMMDGFGRRIDFSNTVWLFTGNVGAARVLQAGSGAAAQPHLRQELLNHFAPEFLGRLDSILAANPLKQEHMRQLADMQITSTATTYARERGITLTVDDAVRDHFARMGYDPSSGARELKRVLAEEWQTPVSRAVLEKKVATGDTVAASLSADARELVLTSNGQEAGRHLLRTPESQATGPSIGFAGRAGMG